MSTDVDVANYALSRVGEETITSLGEASLPAETCNLWFAHARRRVLKLSNWTEATKRAELSADPTAPLYGYEARYALPSDFVRLVSVENGGLDGNYAEETGFILANLGPPLNIQYIFDNTDISTYGDDLVELLVISLSFDIVARLSQSRSLRKDIRDELADAIVMYKGTNAAGQPPRPIRAGSWIEAHGGGRDPSRWYS